MSLLQMSFTGAILVIFILAVRLIAVNKLPKTTFLILWGLVLIRLLVPFSVPTNFSVYTLFNSIDTLHNTTNESPIARLLPITSVSQEATGGQIGTEVQQVISSVSVWEIGYFIGVTVCALLFMTAYILCFKKFRRSYPVENEFIAAWLSEHKLKRKIRFRQCDSISSPLTYGVFFPVILVPQTTNWENTKELNYVLLHEYSHIRRCDYLFKFIAVIAVCIHWFNPLVWLMYFFFNRDLELSCDEFVILESGRKARADYARTLIAMEERHSSPLLVCNEFSMNISEERITAIMKTKPITIVSCIIASVLVLSLFMGFMTSANAESIDVNLPTDTPTKNSTDLSVDNTTVPIQQSIHKEESTPVRQDWIWPTKSTEISTRFGNYSRPTGNVFNDHINISCEEDDEIVAAISGTVEETGFDVEYGNYIVITGENNIKTVYGHLETILVTDDYVVNAGERIGIAGKSGTVTGYSLSFAVFADNEAVDPMTYYE